MCLDFVDEKMKACKVGWKIIRQKNDGFLYSEFVVTKPLEIGKWLDEKDYRDGDEDEDYIEIEDVWSKEYPRGWHIYNRKKDALSQLPYAQYTSNGSNTYVMFRVKVDKPLCSGMQYVIMGAVEITVSKFIKITKVYDKASSSPRRNK